MEDENYNHRLHITTDEEMDEVLDHYKLNQKSLMLALLLSILVDIFTPFRRSCLTKGSGLNIINTRIAAMSKTVLIIFPEIMEFITLTIEYRSTIMISNW